MDHNLTGSPLEAIQAAYLDLTAKIEAKMLSVDDALAQLRTKESVDAAGYTWRIDPISRSFIRLAPEPGASWTPADPSEYASQPGQPGQPSPPGKSTQNGMSAQPAQSGQPGLPAQAAQASVAVPPSAVPVPVNPGFPTRRKGLFGRWNPSPIVLAAAAAVLTAIVTATVVLQFAGSDAPAAATSSSPATVRTSGGAQGQVYPVPPQAVRNAVQADLLSNDVNRIGKVTANPGSTPNQRLLVAATYSGWARLGLTIRQGPPVGEPSGLAATQTWELWDRNKAIAAASVTWRRATPNASWLLAAWPDFRPIA